MFNSKNPKGDDFTYCHMLLSNVFIRPIISQMKGLNIDVIWGKTEYIPVPEATGPLEWCQEPFCKDLEGNKTDKIPDSRCIFHHLCFTAGESMCKLCCLVTQWTNCNNYTIAASVSFKVVVSPSGKRLRDQEKMLVMLNKHLRCNSNLIKNW